MCFEKDNRPTIGKLDLRAVKYIFVDYSDTQKGYVCWSPVKRQLFVSMDVTFRDNEPYYPFRVTSLFGDSPDTSSMRREGESNAGEKLVHVGMMPCSILIDQIMPGRSAEESKQSAEELEQSAEVSKNEMAEVEDSGAPTQRELRVYARRRKHNEETVPAVTLVPASFVSRATPTREISSSDSEYPGDTILLDSPPTSMPLRRTSRANARCPPNRYDFPHDIAQFVSYSSISPAHTTFIASLDSISILMCWQVAKEDPKWNATMHEELRALDKNHT
jgi:hypothetical protein